MRHTSMELEVKLMHVSLNVKVAGTSEIDRFRDFYTPGGCVKYYESYSVHTKHFWTLVTK